MGDSYIVLQVCHVPPHSVEGDKGNQEDEYTHMLTPKCTSAHGHGGKVLSLFLLWDNEIGIKFQ